jgi:hypothetical protein
MRRIRRHLTFANVVSVIALFVALGGTALAATIITKNSQVRRGTISGHHPPKGDHPNIIGGSLSGTDLSSKLKGSLRVHCPNGMRRAGDLCFEDSLRADASLEDALKACADARRRLPTLAELAVVFENSGAPQADQWVAAQWTTSNPYSLSGGLLGEDSSRHFIYGRGGATPTYKSPYRCVSTPTS